MIYLKEFHFHLLLFSARSGVTLTPSFPRTCCSLSSCADAYLLFGQLHVPPASALFVYGLELLWLRLLQALFPYETEKKEEQLGASSVALRNTNECFPVSASVPFDGVFEEQGRLLKLWLFCNQTMHKKV